MRVFLIFILTLLLFSCSKSNFNTQEEKEKLGKRLFFDTLLSKNNTQSCSTCHNPNNAFIDDRDNMLNKSVSLGDDGISFGSRNAPTISYALFSPNFTHTSKGYIGGQFLDGRAKDLKEQAKAPILNPIEMNIPSMKFLVDRLKQDSSYVKDFRNIYGNDIFNDINNTYDAIADSIASFEKTKEFAPFDSKYDRYLKGTYELSVLEDLGRSLFFSQNNTNCASCHLLKKEDDKNETFSNYEYHNIGTPKNKFLKHITINEQGLLENTLVNDINQSAKFKVPTLRNIAITSPYMHNGVFKNLRTVIEFYDKYNNPDRKINPETNQSWNEAVSDKTISLEKLKAKKLTKRKIDALIAFLNLLTDKKYEHLIKEEQ